MGLGVRDMPMKKLGDAAGQGTAMRTMLSRINTYSAPSTPASRSTGVPPTRPKAYAAWPLARS
jgi:hypothetical protein